MKIADFLLLANFWASPDNFAPPSSNLAFPFCYPMLCKHNFGMKITFTLKNSVTQCSPLLWMDPNRNIARTYVITVTSYDSLLYTSRNWTNTFDAAGCLIMKWNF